jgi:iron(III)-enterobactin esterase
MKLETHSIGGGPSIGRRTLWHLTTGSPRRIALFLDGEHYLEQMDAPSILLDLTHRGLIPPMACLFVSNANPAARHRDFCCNPDYMDFIMGGLVPWMRERHGPQVDGGDHLIAGTSLSGLQAAYTALHQPETFGRALCQSGSFWWNGEWLSRQLPTLGPAGDFWLSVGTKEQGKGMVHPPTSLVQDADQDAAVERFTAALQPRCRRVRHHLYQGGHDPGNWRDELSEALPWLLVDA